MTIAMAVFHTNAVTTLHITNGSVAGPAQRRVSGPVAAGGTSGRNAGIMKQ